MQLISHSTDVDLIEKARTVVGIEASQLNRLAERLDENFSKAVGAPKELCGVRACLLG